MLHGVQEDSGMKQKGEAMSRLMWGVAAALVLAGLAALLMMERLESDGVIAVSEQAPIVAAETIPTSLPESVEPVGAPEEADSPNGVAGAHTNETGGSPVETSRSAGVTIDGQIEPGEYGQSIEAAGMVVSWANDGERLMMGVISPGAGYIAVGLDPDRSMEGANFILGAVSDGVVVMRDDYGTGLFAHAADIDRGGTDDILEAAGSESDAGTVIEFAIPLNSGDPKDKPLVPGETYAILVAYHRSNDSFAAKHSERGGNEIALIVAPIP